MNSSAEEDEYEIAQQHEMTVAEYHIFKEKQQKEEYRKMIRYMEFVVAVENTANQFIDSAFMVDDSDDFPRVHITASVEAYKISGTWELTHGHLPTNEAWISLCAKRSLNQHIYQQHVHGTAGTFTFKGLRTGQYVVRLYGDKFVSACISESEILVVGHKVVKFSSRIQNERITFQYELDKPSAASNWDWVGIYEKGRDSGNRKYLTYAYAKAGQVSLRLPRPASEYEARLFLSGSYYNEQATTQFSNPRDFISADFCRSRMVIKAKWRLWNVKPTAGDWIGLFNVLDADNEVIISIDTKGAAVGEAEIRITKSFETSMYELRHFPALLGGNTVHTRAAVPINLED